MASFGLGDTRRCDENSRLGEVVAAVPEHVEESHVHRHVAGFDGGKLALRRKVEVDILARCDDFDLDRVDEFVEIPNHVSEGGEIIARGRSMDGNADILRPLADHPGCPAELGTERHFGEIRKHLLRVTLGRRRRGGRRHSRSRWQRGRGDDRCCDGRGRKRGVCSTMSRRKRPARAPLR